MTGILFICKLLRTPLFIAVLAIDERYVTRALEKHYAGVLFHQGQPSGTDYLEKIIQIPYRVRPIAHSALPNYLHQQMELETPDTATPQEIAAASTPSDNNQPSRFLPDTAVESVQEQSANPAAERNEDEQENFLTTETIKFSNEEFQQLLNCCQQTDLSPRMIKRLVNVYKIFKIIEVLSNKVSPKNTQRSQEPILAVLALSARYPDLIRDVLADVTIQFEQIMRENHPQNLRNVKLLELLQKTLTALQQATTGKADFYLQRECQKLTQAATNLLKDVTLADFDSETLNLIRSFCFFGDIGYNPEDSRRSV